MPSPLLPSLLWTTCLLLCAGCATPTAPASDAPYLLVLGTAQDGGLPQLGCTAACCERARRDPSRRRLTTALLLADPRSGGRWLFDAGPDLPELLERARGHPPGHAPASGRPAPFDGVFLTHAHIGHYAGLAHLGREAYGARGQRLYASARMVAFLSSNGPWDLAVSAGHLVPEVITPGAPLVLARHDDGTPRLSVHARAVPHRAEYTDTLAFSVEHADVLGNTWRALYVPDVDKWSRVDGGLEGLLDGVDVAYVDGTFFDADELPGRSMADIPHPFMVETLEQLRARPELLPKVVFTHLNHGNPAADSTSDAAQAARAAGARVAREGERFPLGR